MALSLQYLRKRINLSKIFYLVLLLLGLYLLFSGFYIKYRRSILSFNTTPSNVSFENQRTARPSQIKIEKASIDLPIEEGIIKEGVWQISDSGASHLDTSARPGETGNIVIYGHNKYSLFGRLMWTELLGENIEVMSSDGSSYLYKVSEVKTVAPSDIEEVMPTDYEVLTVYTCIGLFDSKRLVIKAKPVEY